MDTEEKLQQLFKLKPLQDKVIVMRKEYSKICKKYYKQSCEQEMRNLVNVEMDIVQTELKMPDPQKIPPMPEPLPRSKMDETLQDQFNTIKALEYLDMI